MRSDFHVGPWLVRPGVNTISKNGFAVRLEPKVMEVLVCLASQAGELVPKDVIFKTVWPDTFVSDDALIRSISELRRAFEDDAREPRFIETIPKRGYRLVAAVAPLNGDKVARPGLAVSGPARAIGKWNHIWLAVGLVLVGAIVAFGGRKLGYRVTNSGPPIHSLAVLPLKNLSADPSQKYFAAGMTEELITDLSQISALKVISRTSSDLYEDTNKSLPDIARELHVEAIIEGSVARSGNRVRVTAQLIYAPDDRNLWAQSYEREVQDVITLQGTLAKAIAEEIQVQVQPSERERLSSRPLVDPRVLDAYMNGNYHLHRVGRGFGDEESTAAAKLFQQAIEYDANFGPAYLGLAYAHNGNGGTVRFNPTPQDYEIRKAAARKAAELDPNSAAVHELLANLAIDDWRWTDAEEEYRRAIALNSNRAESHDRFGYFLIAIGRPQEGVQELRRAQELDPNNDHLANYFFYQGNYEESIQLTRRDLERQPDDGLTHYGQYQTYALAGMYPEAIEELKQAFKLMGFEETASEVDRAYRKAGFHAALRTWAVSDEKMHKSGLIYTPGMLAEIYCLLGDKNRALYWLEDAYRHKYSLGADGGLLWLKGNPFYGPLRSDPRYADLVRRVGLPQ